MSDNKDKDNKEKLKALQLTVDKLEKTYGKGTVMRLNDQVVSDIPAISKGSLGLDIALEALRDAWRKRKVTRGDVFFGSEFGSDRLRQFPRRSPKLGAGNRGYYFWPTIEAMSPTINAEYRKALDRITANLTRLG
jgi:hypothetical protein